MLSALVLPLQPLLTHPLPSPLTSIQSTSPHHQVTQTLYHPFLQLPSNLVRSLLTYAREYIRTETSRRQLREVKSHEKKKPPGGQGGVGFRRRATAFSRTEVKLGRDIIRRVEKAITWKDSHKKRKQKAVLNCLQAERTQFQ